MLKKRKTRQATEFGDFQTPRDLSGRVCDFLAEQGLTPRSILEPNCGKGNLLLAALDSFPSVNKAIGIDINSTYITYLQSELAKRACQIETHLWQGDFFETDWRGLLESLPEPILVLGNPPWVTNSELATLGSVNLPPKANFLGFSGFEAKTGKSNFDISEWMLIRLLESTQGRNATIAMLCKTAVARKALFYAWKHGIGIGHASMYLIDAQESFNASVDACLLVCGTVNGEGINTCDVYQSLSKDSMQNTFGFRNNHLVANIPNYERWKHLEGKERNGWRSGIKHDCSQIMELKKERDGYRNGLGELCDLEETYVYPMLKGSEIAKEVTPQPSRWMLVTQRRTGEDTGAIRLQAPKTWKYLGDHSEFLDGRKSSLYKNRPRYSIFGIGEYSFSPWKVAISALYKRLHFTVVGGFMDKPVVLDDTCNFFSCATEKEALHLAYLLNSEPAKQFLDSFIFWDAKRPITVDILRKLDLGALDMELKHH